MPLYGTPTRNKKNDVCLVYKQYTLIMRVNAPPPGPTFRDRYLHTKNNVSAEKGGGIDRSREGLSESVSFGSDAFFVKALSSSKRRSGGGGGVYSLFYGDIQAFAWGVWGGGVVNGRAFFLGRGEVYAGTYICCLGPCSLLLAPCSWVVAVQRFSNLFCSY